MNGGVNGGTLTDHVKYEYYNSATGDLVFWHCRARVENDPSRRKTFWYLTANPEHPGLWSMALKEHPGDAGRPCLFRNNLLTRAHRVKSDEPALWAEGEKDALAAGWRGLGIDAAVSHHGGADKATEEQAEHFRGYRGPVLVAMDRDDAGAACALKRYRLLRAVGLRAQIVRPADGVLAGGGGCGAGVVCECPDPCLPPSQQWRGADLADHEAAGYGLRDLVRIRPRDLDAAAERHAGRAGAGWVYGQPEVDAVTTAAIAENKRRNGGKLVISWKREKRSR